MTRTTTTVRSSIPRTGISSTEGRGADTVVAIGSDTVNIGVDGHIIGKGLKLSVLDWLQGRFSEPDPENINPVLDVALAQRYAQAFQCGVQPDLSGIYGPQITMSSRP